MSNKVIRNAIRIPAWILLVITGTWSIAIPVIKGDDLFLTENHGYVIGGCIVLLLSIEAIRKAIDSKASKYAERENKD